MQKVDALTDLRLDDVRIDHDAKVLSLLKDRARNLMLRPLLKHSGGKHPTLYKRFRGKGFPLQSLDGINISSWRALTPWMKVQLATLVLGERGYMQFKIHIRDDLRESWRTAGKDPKNELRNAISRNLKRRFGEDAPWFFFILEDRTKAGQLTRAHGHGSIELRRAELPKKGKGSRTLVRLAKVDEENAGLEAGKLKIIDALWAASGGREPKVSVSSGVDQSRNVWLGKPYHPIFNSQWVDYAFKNAMKVSSVLGDSRLAMHQPLLQETQRLWHLVREGEAAIDRWPT